MIVIRSTHIHTHTCNQIKNILLCIIDIYCTSTRYIDTKCDFIDKMDEKSYYIPFIIHYTRSNMWYHIQPRARKSRSWNRFYAKGIFKCILHEITTEQCLCMVLYYYAVETICVVCQKLPGTQNSMKFNQRDRRRFTQQ